MKTYKTLLRVFNEHFNIDDNNDVIAKNLKMYHQTASRIPLILTLGMMDIKVRAITLR